MPVRSLRLLTFPPSPEPGGERGATLLRERPASPPEAPRGGRAGQGGHAGQGGRDTGGRGSGGRDGDRRDGGGRGDGRQDDNPFAPPPEGSPDRPWRPRHPEGSQGSGQGPHQGHGHGDGSPWGKQWSDRQPGRSPGGFGERPGGGPQGPDGPVGPGMRWDPTDPVQRRARYALLSGMWAVFFALFSWPYVALLLGVLALYWGGSALRAKPRGAADPDTPAPRGAARPQTTAAIGGLITASLALVLVASTFTVQFVYRDYYTCVNDALTHEAKQSCDKLLPQELRGVLGVGNS
ncbi:hypothetical protein AB0L59_06795 [Streptomyces sp. NPDC052109]|uniref:hypothetical protein n=1 Tax=Streptomyces sp. NPDC052109 TaxID=3155527 RepID=UPI003437B328